MNLPAPTLAYLIGKYQKAVAGYQTEMQIFVAENLAMGISSAPGKVKLIGDTMKDVQYYGSVGSLYECLDALNHIKITPDMAPFLTQPRLDYLKNRIVAILSSL